MIETLYIQINDPKAYKLIKDLEDLDILKVLPQLENNIGKLSEKYAGKLSEEGTHELQEFVSQSRGEWNKDNI